MGLYLIDEAERCLQCRKPMCQQGCPVHTPIPQVIAAFKERDVMGAGQMLFENNPLSLACAVVCNHEQQCAGHCVLGRKGAPVHFFEMEKYISDAYLDRAKFEKKERKPQNVAVIGAGPAGMTVAFILAKNGYGVTIFEWKDKIGGVMQYGIPEFRLHKTVLERYKARLLELGVKIRPNTTIGAVLNVENLLRDGYDAVFVGTGVGKPRSLGVPGECLGNVYFGLDYLVDPDACELGKRVAVLGMGNTAMDVARTALRHGAQEVTLYARSNHISASSHEVSYAQLDGAQFVFGKSIQRLTPQGPVFRDSILDEDDCVVGAGETEELIPADSVIIAVSQGPRRKLIRTTAGLEGNEKGLLIVDENCMTTREGVFAAGDVVHGGKTVVHAVEGARRAAEGMMRYLER